jgi:glycosyltransferase involved in cell wall biosynthesis
MGYPDLSISAIIPVWNGRAYFRQCLSAILEATPPPAEIIVVADGYTDGSWQIAEERGANVLRLPKTGGPARARNLGAAASLGDILLFIDADVVVPREVIGTVERVFRDDPGLAAVFGSYDSEPSETNFLSQYKNLFHHYVHQRAREEASTFWAGFGAIRRDVFEREGGFDERYSQPSIEDIELGYRLKRGGHPVRLRKDLQVKHLKRWGVVSLLKSDLFQRAIPWTALILRDRRFVNDLNLTLSSRLSVVLVYVLLAAALGALWWPGSVVAGCGIVLSLLVMNARLYRFFRERRGLWFALRTIPWHWFYYFYSGLGFVLGAGRELFLSLRPARPSRAGLPKEGVCRDTRPGCRYGP